MDRETVYPLLIGVAVGIAGRLFALGLLKTLGLSVVAGLAGYAVYTIAQRRAALAGTSSAGRRSADHPPE